jgi:hypothetical protein
MGMQLFGKSYVGKSTEQNKYYEMWYYPLSTFSCRFPTTVGRLLTGNGTWERFKRDLRKVNFWNI